MTKKSKRISWKDLLILSVSALRANFLRSLLTILGVSIGVFSVVGVMTALTAVRQSIDSSLNIFGADVFQISKDPAINLSGNRRSRRPPITPKQAAEFKSMMDSDAIPTTLSATDRGEWVTYNGERAPSRISIIGTNENYMLTNKYDLAMGRPLSQADIEFNRPVTVIGHYILDTLFPNESPLDKTIYLEDGRFTVIGVLKEKGDLFGESMDGVALIPHTKFVETNWHRRRSMEIAVQSGSVENIPNVQQLATGHMRLVRGLEPEDENNFEITSNQALQNAFGEIAGIVAIAGLLVSGIALVCAGIGIMNIMLVSVSERVSEIGLRKALGARQKDILAQFLLEAIFLSEAGAAIGILLGMGAGNVVAKFANSAMIIPWFWVGTAIAICSFIGIAFGFLPALRAARLHPVEALRQD
ncbi:ABC transporter permease [Puniceicoccaceae bacterium K14]|nr:ABC transporter permease [Puniceicoccaceae bacterium K14]